MRPKLTASQHAPVARTDARDRPGNPRQMHRFAKQFGLLSMALICLIAQIGCGAKPLKMKNRNRDMAPWCAANERVQVGERVVGSTPYGDKWKTYLVDHTGREYDPESVADQAWSYLEGTGDAAKLVAAYNEQQAAPSMTVISVQPLVIILETEIKSQLPKRKNTKVERPYWTAIIYSVRRPKNLEGLQWFSPDLRKPVAPLTFTRSGVAEIPLAKGKLTLTRDGEYCKTARD